MGGHGDERVAGGQLLIGQSPVLRSEENRHRNRSGVLDDFRGDFAGRDERPAVYPFAGGSSRDPSKALEGLFERGKDLRLMENVLGRRGHHLGLPGERVLFGRDQDQPGEAHVLHGPADRPDIAGVLRPYQDDGDIPQGVA